jgi:hypothetical protein
VQSRGNKKKHGVLVRVTCEVVSGYICTMKIHTAENA